MAITAPHGGEDSDACAHGVDMNCSVAMALSAAAHDSFDKVAAGETYYGLRAQKTDRAEAAHNAPRRQTQRAARGPELFQLFEEEPGGLRPEAFADPRPQERVQRHVVEHFTDLVRVAPMLQILDAPVRLLDPPMTEQVIEVTEISCSSCPSRTVLGEPQMVPRGGFAVGGPEGLSPRTEFVFLCRADRSHSSSRPWSFWRSSKVFSLDKVRSSGLRSRSLTFQSPVVSVMISFHPHPSALPVDLPGEAIQGFFFALFSRITKKVRRLLLARVRGCPRTRAHPRPGLMTPTFTFTRTRANGSCCAPMKSWTSRGHDNRGVFLRRHWFSVFGHRGAH